MQPTWQGLGKVQFSKWPGLGNNYIVFHNDQIPFELTAARGVCSATVTSASAQTASW